MKTFHTGLIDKWQNLSLAEQLGNVGSEVNRIIKFKKKDEKLFENAVLRALELLDLTIADHRWKDRLKELTRSRELLRGALFGNNEYDISLEYLNKYFYSFAIATRLKK